MATNVSVDYGGGVTAQLMNQMSITTPNVESIINLSMTGQYSGGVASEGAGNTYFDPGYVVDNYTV